MPSHNLEHSHPLVTDRNHGSLLNMLGWFVIVCIALVVISRLGMKWAKSRKQNLDDMFVVLAMVRVNPRMGQNTTHSDQQLFAVAQTLCVSIGVANGLGDPEEISTDQLQTQQKVYHNAVSP
jgi:F0F1-type ATP synthase membrane subunit a